MNEPAEALRREISPRSALLITAGAMIGSGIFATPHDVALRVSSPSVALVLWLLGGVLSLLGALSFAELGAALPETGGMYVYLRRSFGPRIAFTFAWSMLVVLVPSSTGYFAQVAASHIAAALRPWISWAPDSYALKTTLALSMLASITFANVRGVRAGVLLQDAATAVKLVGIAALAMVGLFAAVPTLSPASAPSSSALSALLAAFVPVLWAYDGWVEITSVAGEVRTPERSIPRSLALGTALVTGLYLLVNVGYLRLLGMPELAREEAPAVRACSLVFGPWGGVAVSALVGISTYGGCAVSLLTGTRVVYAVAKAGEFFSPVARTNAAGVPHVAVLSCAGLALLYTISPLGKLGEIFVVGAWPFYALGALAVVRLRKKEPALERPFRTPFYPLPVVVFVLACALIVGAYAITDTKHMMVSAGVVFLGWLLYPRIVARQKFA